MAAPEGDGCLALQFGQGLRYSPGYGKADGSASEQRRQDGEAVVGEELALGHEPDCKRDEEQGEVANQDSCPLFDVPKGKEVAGQRREYENHARHVPRQRQVKQQDDCVAGPAHNRQQSNLRYHLRYPARPLVADQTQCRFEVHERCTPWGCLPDYV